MYQYCFVRTHQFVHNQEISIGFERLKPFVPLHEATLLGPTRTKENLVDPPQVCVRNLIVLINDVLWL